MKETHTSKFLRFVNTIASVSINTNTIWSAIKEVRLKLFKRTGDKQDVWKEKCSDGFIDDKYSNLVELAKILEIDLGIDIYV